jgi:hypothetical protein
MLLGVLKFSGIIFHTPKELSRDEQNHKALHDMIVAFYHSSHRSLKIQDINGFEINRFRTDHDFPESDGKIIEKFMLFISSNDGLEFSIKNVVSSSFNKEMFDLTHKNSKIDMNTNNIVFKKTATNKLILTSE